MAKEPTTVTPKINGKYVNPLDIEWPQDTYGITSMLKKEGVRAIGRIAGDAEKHATVLATLRALAEHAGVKLDDQRQEAERIVAGIENVRAAEAARADADNRREVARLEALLVAAKAERDAAKAV